MRSVRFRLLALAMLAVMTLYAETRAATPASPPVPAVWERHALIVALTGLPRSYDCREVWYRFRGLLLAIGAEPDSVSVTAYHCPGPSPSAELQFALPGALPARQRGLADFQAIPTAVTVAPGSPAHFESGDCEFVRQLRDELLSSLPLKVDGPPLSCGAAPARGQLAYQLRIHSLQSPTTAAGAATMLSPSAKRPGALPTS